MPVNIPFHFACKNAMTQLKIAVNIIHYSYTPQCPFTCKSLGVVRNDAR